jgi:hypothetical protein
MPSIPELPLPESTLRAIGDSETGMRQYRNATSLLNRSDHTNCLIVNPRRGFALQIDLHRPHGQDRNHRPEYALQ